MSGASGFPDALPRQASIWPGSAGGWTASTLWGLDEPPRRYITDNLIIPSGLQTLFWDTNLDEFIPEACPDYTILRVLELGDDAAVDWLGATFSQSEICRVLRTEGRLSEKSATFWALVYGVSSGDVAALNGSRQ